MLNGDEEALDGLGGATIRMLKKGMGVEYTQTAMDDNTWKCRARYTIEESAKKRSRAADKKPYSLHRGSFDRSFHRVG